MKKKNILIISTLIILLAVTTCFASNSTLSSNIKDNAIYVATVEDEGNAISTYTLQDDENMRITLTESDETDIIIRGYLNYATGDSVLIEIPKTSNFLLTPPTTIYCFNMKNNEVPRLLLNIRPGYSYFIIDGRTISQTLIDMITLSVRYTIHSFNNFIYFN